MLRVMLKTGLILMKKTKIMNLFVVRNSQTMKKSRTEIYSMREAVTMMMMSFQMIRVSTTKVSNHLRRRSNNKNKRKRHLARCFQK